MPEGAVILTSFSKFVSVDGESTKSALHWRGVDISQDELATLYKSAFCKLGFAMNFFNKKIGVKNYAPFFFVNTSVDDSFM